jgi:PAS domain S-box-containing protein
MTVRGEPVDNREWESKYLDLLNAAADVVVILQDEKVAFINATVAELFGYSVEEVVGRPYLEFVTSDEHETSLKRYRGMLEGMPEKAAQEITVHARDGSTRTIEFTETLVEYRGRPAAMVIGRDITERRRVEEALRESEARYRAVFESATDALLIQKINPDGSPGRFIEANDFACRRLGYTRKELFELSPFDIASPNEPINFPSLATELFSKGHHSFEARVVAKDGREIPAEIILRLFEFQGQSMVLVNSRDITARKRYEEELRRAKEMAEAANRAKAEFLTNMGHELRTPLSGAMGMLELLLATPLDSQQQQYARTAQHSVGALLTVMSDLLEFSKLEAGKLFINPTGFDLRQAVEDVVQILVMKASEKGIRLTVNYPPQAPRKLIGDARRIRQVLMNLLDNAVKFTDFGRIDVRVSGERLSPQEARVEIGVEDTGIGIPEDTLGRVFEKFTQADASASRRHGGTGLGLAIARQLVELMGGQIHATSRLGSGSRLWFELTLPLKQPETDAGEDATHRPPPPAKAKGNHPRRVLVVEDDQVNQEVAATILRRLGCRVDAAGGGQQAITMATETNYDLIFMDCQMPEIDGFEATAEIRRRETANNHRARIVAMTAHTLAEDRQRCLNSGMDDYLAKPATLEDFEAVLQRSRA